MIADGLFGLLVMVFLTSPENRGFWTLAGIMGAVMLAAGLLLMAIGGGGGQVFI
jgi:hypothetical protein